MNNRQRLIPGRKDARLAPAPLGRRENTQRGGLDREAGCASCPESVLDRPAGGGQGFSHEFSRVKLTGGPALPPGARAMAKNGTVHLGPGAADLPEAQYQRLLAHESVHAAQQAGAARRFPAGREELEGEAHDLAPQILTRRAPAPFYAAPGGTALFDTPQDRLTVERARKRLALLKRFYDEYTVREVRKQKIESKRDPLLEKRRAMDLAMLYRDRENIERDYGNKEEANLAGLNRKPLKIEVTEGAVRFHLRIQVRFEGKTRAQAKKDFETLQKNFQAAVDLIWNQRISGMPLSGRDFKVIPEMTLIDSDAPRDENFWLISVRPTDKGPITYEGKPFADMPPPPDSITSVTRSDLAGGVMSIPPLHITMPDVLGHELMHLFGFVDRYLILHHRDDPKKFDTMPMRDTSDRPDPLGAETGKILVEDINFLFEKLGVYQADENRGLDVLQQLEGQGLRARDVQAEMRRQEEIIQLGHDPRSLIRERQDFQDKVKQSAEDL